MKALLQSFDDKMNPMREIMQERLSPILLLVIRVYMAKIFFLSGWGKFQDTLNGSFDNVVYLYTDIHPVPFLPPALSAAAGTGGELIFGVLLAFGLFGRLGALALFFMTLVIQFVVPAAYEIANPEHYVWMMLLSVSIVFGSGKLSGDHFLLKYIRHR
jgi:putative oxidoreductase